jgi:hypothetical protein
MGRRVESWLEEALEGDDPWSEFHNLESALEQRSVRSVLAAGLVPATLLLFGLGASGTHPLAAIQSAEQSPRQEERPLTRQGHGAAVLNGRIYVIGGAGENNKPFGSVQVYDPATGTWAARANMPTARGLFGTSAVGGTIYAIGGTTRGEDKLAVVEAYDTVTDAWTRKADMPTPRNALSTAVVDGKVYAIGGWGYERPDGGWESIDPTATGQDFSTVEAYDPKTDTWVTRADMPTPRSHMTVSALGGKIPCNRRRGADRGGTQLGVPFVAGGLRHRDESLGTGCGPAYPALRVVGHCRRRTHLRDGRRIPSRTDFVGRRVVAQHAHSVRRGGL